MWRNLWATTGSPHLFWGVTDGVSWVAHWSPVLPGPEYRYFIVLDGLPGRNLDTFDTRPSQDDVEAAVAAWFRTQWIGS